MTSETVPGRPRFPFGLTVAAVIVIAICAALGVWQLGRAAWKSVELKRIAALHGAPPVPLGPVLANYVHGLAMNPGSARTASDASFRRVAVDCGQGSTAAPYRLTPDNGDWVARAQANCRLDGPYLEILVDRGILNASRGATTAPTTQLPPPTHVEGVLYRNAHDAYATRSSTAPFVLVAERESPAPPGVTPAPYPDAASNLEYVGTYAPTWFGLAVVALCFYAAMLWRRYHPKP